MVRTHLNDFFFFFFFFCGETIEGFQQNRWPQPARKTWASTLRSSVHVTFPSSRVAISCSAVPGFFGVVQDAHTCYFWPKVPYRPTKRNGCSKHPSQHHAPLATLPHSTLLRLVLWGSQHDFPGVHSHHWLFLPCHHQTQVHVIRRRYLRSRPVQGGK